MKRTVPVALRTAIAVMHDTFMAAASFVLALYLRLGDEQFHVSEPYLLSGTLAFGLVALGVFAAMRLYRGLWRYASLPDLMALTKAASLAVALFYGVILFAANRLEGVPRSLPFIQWLLLLAMLGSPRFLYRALKDRTLHFDFKHDATRQIPLILVGATGSAELFMRNCRRDAASPYRVVGLLDEDLKKKNLTLHGVRIYGGAADLPSVAVRLARRGLKPQRVVVCDDGLSAPALDALLKDAEALGMTLGRLPNMSELRDGAPARSEIQAIAIEDLLGRAQNVHDRAAMRALVAGRRVVVTGAGGSIGSELARQIAGLAPKEIFLLEQSEHALYQIDLELHEIAPEVPRRALLADVRASSQVRRLFAECRPELVFHAAAVKHVPLSEANPLAALETNVIGTRNVAESSLACGAAAMVLISTDKAVNPCNVMGASKRLAESCCQALAREAGAATRFITVRFGNVLGSTGSVVPLFTRQLARGGPLTVTHPDMVRYFMTIREAVELVIQAAALGAQMPKQEAIFVLDMGKPVRIVDLATQMIRLSGLKPGRDIEIVYTGLRPGEKLFEELFYDAEKVQRTAFPGLLIAAAQAADVETLKKSLDLLAEHCRQRDENSALALLAALVPEYVRHPAG